MLVPLDRETGKKKTKLTDAEKEDMKNRKETAETQEAARRRRK